MSSLAAAPSLPLRDTKTGTQSQPFFRLLFLFAFAVGFYGTLFPSMACASGWHPVLEGSSVTPARFLAVDKSRQKALLLEHNSPLRVSERYTCTTGQVRGDKQVEGDKKTPEGVYFVRRHIASGLDWGLYGGVAYTLDYPNPVDRIREKTGYGIWVHGRGHDIVPRETQGCVAINNDDLKVVGEKLLPGTPVVIAKSLDVTGKQTTEDRKIEAAVADLSQAWLDAWGNRSDEFFTFFDPAAYDKAHRKSFAHFSANKKRLFARFDWIMTWTPDIRVIKGPGYWVSYFPQYYRAPNMTVQGQRRLYWQKNANGELRIVGMGWSPRKLGLEGPFLAAVKPQLEKTIHDWLGAWRQADLTKYTAFYTEDASQGKQRGITAIRQHKQRLWQNAQPATIDFTNIRYTVTNKGIVLTAIQRYSNSSGYTDTGQKRLVLRPVGDNWRIASENWSRLH